ncbi:UDP-glucuronosyltransferase 1-7C [Scaptodrosophila lebanonensis]|uniref:UDP-glucuronosyltransferase 1-7C n=1 Tax=Drosophila lebanonensis TaxID=7225 RepID=A0A6J2U4X1_DROLE|nr:UDP-glucuronosyltransferase 1-7C [Scaptodrosophila lebanonensis]
MTTLLRTCTLIRLLFILVTAGQQKVQAGNVLAVFPHFGFSHFKVVQPILDALAAAGHKVTVISYVKNQNLHENYEQLLISPLDEDQTNTTINVVPLTEHTPTRSLPILLKEYWDLHVEGQHTCELLFASGHVEKVLQRHRQEQPYDVLFTEYFNADCQLAIAQQLQLPIVALSTCTLMPFYYDRIDLPDTPAFVQSEFVGFAQPLKWHERLLNFVQAKLLKLLYRHHSNRVDNALVKRYLNIDVDVAAVAHAQTAVIFVNQHYTLMGSRPRTRQLVEVGGVHISQKQSKPLPELISRFLQQSPLGVIYISWGSMVRASSIGGDKLADILQALQQQPLRVICKWETDQTPQVDAKQFLFIKWAPQLDILCHPKVKLFWTHGGLLGTTEGVHCGKPMLVTPIYGDQFVNAFAVLNRGIGLKLDYDQINVENLQEALQQLSQPSFATRAQKLAHIFNERERTPLETAIWALEHVMEHGLFGAELLRSPGVELNWFVYNSLDSIFLLLTVLVLAPLLLVYSCRWTCGCKKQSTQQQKRKSKRA